MYFDNIANAELNKLPKVYMPNFNIKLSVALTHDLFKVETIISDKLYRVYPLFNCKSIQSSNPNDEIFENRLIVCTKETTETYLTFISDDGPIQDFNNMGSYFDIGDNLTMAQYNDIVQLERMNNTIINPIHIQTNTFNTDYANYDFKISGLILDNGIAISSLTDLKVKLSNPVFSHSTYTLKLQALRITNTNIEEVSDNKTIIPITVELVNGEYVNIPTTDLQVGDVILYDCDVVITHDKPTLTGTVLDTIGLKVYNSSNVEITTAEIGETITLKAELTDTSRDKMSGVTVTFKVYQEGSVVSTSTADTDTNGIATETYTCSGGDITIVATAYNCDSAGVGIEVTKLTTDLSINVPALVYSDVFDVTGVLKEHTSQNVISGASVKLYMEHNSETTLQATETTDANGEVTFHRSAPTEIDDYNFWLVFEGNSTYSESESGTEHRSVGKETSVLTVTTPANGSGHTLNTAISVTGTLLSNDAEAIKNASIVVSENNTTLLTLTTGNDGSFTGSISGLAAGSHTLKFEYNGNEYYTDCVIDNRTITVNAVSSVTLATDKNILSYADSESATLTATCYDGGGNPVSGASVVFSIVGGEQIGTAQTDSNGVASVTYQSKHSGDLSIQCSCNNITSSSVSIEDCWKYYNNTYLSGTGDVEQSFDYTLPSTFQIEFDYKITTLSQANSTAFYIGETSSKALIIGRISGNDSKFSIWARNGSDVKTYSSTDIAVSNDWQHKTISYNGTTVTFDNISITNLNGVSLTKLLVVNGWHDTANQGIVKDIKIKSL